MSRRDYLWRHQSDKLCAQVHMNIYEERVLKKTVLYMKRDLKRRPLYLKKLLSRRVFLWRHQRDTPYAQGFIYIRFFRRSFYIDIGLSYRSLLRVHLTNTYIQTLIRCVIHYIRMLWFTTGLMLDYKCVLWRALSIWKNGYLGVSSFGATSATPLTLRGLFS